MSPTEWSRLEADSQQAKVWSDATLEGTRARRQCAVRANKSESVSIRANTTRDGPRDTELEPENKHCTPAQGRRNDHH